MWVNIGVFNKDLPQEISKFDKQSSPSCFFWCLKHKLSSVSCQSYIIVSEDLRFPCPHFSANPAFSILFTSGSILKKYHFWLWKMLFWCGQRGKTEIILCFQIYPCYCGHSFYIQIRIFFSRTHKMKQWKQLWME